MVISYIYFQYSIYLLIVADDPVEDEVKDEPPSKRPRNRRRQKQDKAEQSLPVPFLWQAHLPRNFTGLPWPQKLPKLVKETATSGHYSIVTSLVGEMSLHTVTQYLVSMTLGITSLIATKLLNFVEQSQRLLCHHFWYPLCKP